MSKQPLDYYTPPVDRPLTSLLRVVRQVRKAFGFLALAALVFAVLNSSDRSPWQWESAFACMGFAGVYFIAILVCWGVQATVAGKGHAQSSHNATSPDNEVDTTGGGGD